MAGLSIGPLGAISRNWHGQLTRPLLKLESSINEFLSCSGGATLSTHQRTGIHPFRLTRGAYPNEFS